MSFTIRRYKDGVYHHHHLRRKTSTAVNRPNSKQPRRLVLRCLHSADSPNLHQVIGPSCGWSANAVCFGTWLLFENYLVLSAIRSASNVTHPHSLKFCNSLSNMVTLVLLRHHHFRLKLAVKLREQPYTLPFG